MRLPSGVHGRTRTARLRRSARFRRGRNLSPQRGDRPKDSQSNRRVSRDDPRSENLALLAGRLFDTLESLRAPSRSSSWSSPGRLRLTVRVAPRRQRRRRSSSKPKAITNQNDPPLPSVRRVEPISRAVWRVIHGGDEGFGGVTGALSQGPHRGILGVGRGGLSVADMIPACA